MDNLILIIVLFVAIVALMAIAIAGWLFQEHKRLRKDYITLREYIDRVNKDIAGICSAALLVDNKLSDNSEQLKDIIEKVADFEHQEPQGAQPYHSAIQRVRQGAGAEELIQQCGLSREEALLLIRLHGNGR